MKIHIDSAPDARQTPMWGKYLEGIGWKTDMSGKTQIFIRKIPILGVSFAKIQRPLGPLSLSKIDSTAHKNKVAWVLLEPHSIGYNEKALIKAGYKKAKAPLSQSATIKIGLKRSEKDLHASFSENARRNIKKAQTMGLEIREIHMKNPKNWEYFDIFYSLLTNLGKMKKFYVPSRSEYFKKMTAFKATSVLLFAYKDNEPVCVVWYAYFNGVLAYFQTGITNKGYETLANYLLVWEGLKMGQKLGLSVFDFESIFDERFPKKQTPKKKYTDFKKRFHGEIILYPPSWYKTYTLVGKLFALGGAIF